MVQTECILDVLYLCQLFAVGYMYVEAWWPRG